MPRIAIDVRMLYHSGIGTYIRNLLPRIITRRPEIKFSLLGNDRNLAEFTWSKAQNVEIIKFSAEIYSIAEQVQFVRNIPRDTSLFWSPHYVVPICYRGPLLVTVHDVLHLACPSEARGPRKQLYARMMFGNVARKATAVLTDSRFSKDELQRLTSCEGHKIHVIHLGVDTANFNTTKRARPYKKPYLLSVGNLKPHKNIKNLLRAFALLVHKIPHDLIIVGKRAGFLTPYETFVDGATALGNRVHFTGQIEDKLLQQYFAYADAFVFPSLYEGFGLPPLEAMASGCPVIVSSAASLPEVCGSAAIYCNPADPLDIAQKIQDLVSDERVHEDFRVRGREHVRQFDWEKSVSESLCVIDQLL